MLSIGDVAVVEGAGNAVFTVTLSGPSSSTITVEYSTVHVSTSAFDYVPIPNAMTFAPGETGRSMTVQIAEDSVESWTW